MKEFQKKMEKLLAESEVEIGIIPTLKAVLSAVIFTGAGHSDKDADYTARVLTGHWNNLFIECRKKV